MLRPLDAASEVQDLSLEQDEENVNTCLTCCRTWKDCSCYEWCQDKENVIRGEEIVRVEKTTVPHTPLEAVWPVLPTISDGCYFGLPIGR